MNKAFTKYFQFPLCGMAYGADFKTRLRDIVGYCCVHVGEVLGSRMTLDVRLMKAEEASLIGDDSICFNEENDKEIAVLIGAAELDIKFRDVNSFVNRWSKIDAYKTTFEIMNGRDADVRIATELLTETFRDAGLTYREFSVLCAIYSCIGIKNYPVRITRSQIQCRQLGYKTQAIMKEELHMREDGATPLTLRQINYTVDALHERNFFSRARANKRETYYSHRLTKDELHKKLIDSHTYSARFHQNRRERDRLLMQSISAEQFAHKTFSITAAKKTLKNQV